MNSHQELLFDFWSNPTASLIYLTGGLENEYRALLALTEWKYTSHVTEKVKGSIWYKILASS